MSRPATRTARTAVAAAAADPGPDRPRRRPRPARAANVATPGNFTGYGFDQCLAPTQKAMDAWLKSSPFLAVGIYISGDSRACRIQPNLTPPGSRPSSSRAGGCCRSPSARRRRAAPASRATATTRRSSPSPATSGKYRPRPEAGLGGGEQRGRRCQGAGHRQAQHALVRHRGVRPHQPALPRVRHGVPQRLDQPAARARLRLRRLLQRRVRHQDARRRPRQPARRVHAARPDLAGPLGREGQHQLVLHPRGRLAPRRPHEAVPGRPRRDLGRRPDQHRPQLPRPRQGLDCRGRDPLRRRRGSTSPTTRRSAPGPRTRPGQGPPVPAQGAEGLRRQGQRQVQRRDRRRGARLAGGARVHRPATSGPGGTG